MSHIRQYWEDSPRGYRLALAALFGAGLLLRIFGIANTSPASVVNMPMPDDAYYYFTLARNLASGEGFVISGDGVATTGFQPLWGGLLGLINAATGGMSNAALVTTAQALGAVFGFLSAVLLLELVLRLQAGHYPSLLALGAFLLSPQLVKHQLNGMETSLAIFAAFGVLLAILIAAEKGLGRSSAFFLGLVGGLAILARVDNGLLFASGLAWLALKRKNMRASAFALLCGVAIPLLPWAALGWSQGSGPVPESGSAIRNLTLMVRHLPVIGWSDSLLQAPGSFLPFYSQNALEFLSSWLRQLPLLYPTSMPAFALLSIETATRWTGVLAFALAAASVVWAVRSRQDWLILVWSAWASAMLVAYVFVVLAPWFYQRYTAPLAAVFHPLLIVSLARGFERLRLATALAGAVILIGFGALLCRGSYRWIAFGQVPEDGFLEAAKFISEALPDTSRVGVFSAGLIGFYADNPIVALDGKVNAGARDALARGEMFAFVCGADIEYVADWERMVNSLLVRRSRNWSADNLSLLQRIPVSDYNDIMIYSIDRQGCEG